MLPANEKLKLTISHNAECFSNKSLSTDMAAKAFVEMRLSLRIHSILV